MGRRSSPEEATVHILKCAGSVLNFFQKQCEQTSVDNFPVQDTNGYKWIQIYKPMMLNNCAEEAKDSDTRKQLLMAIVLSLTLSV